ncbi:hypothetical protein VM1G_07759 [Cytospora mali]|uniref:Uncharacterized protein n=1 Tax=Cytospora mali TaxID=578113 RepID=A0A194W627_CYTMA|nr:hypothetical protein VM1G_07759 [Valsa mali]
MEHKSNPPTNKASLASQQTEKSNPHDTDIPTGPISTVRESRFFPGGRPAPGVIERGYGTNRGQGDLAQEESSASRGSMAPNVPAVRPPHSANIGDLERNAPTTEAQRRLQGTRPADTWVTGQSWRRGDAREQQQQGQNFAAGPVSGYPQQGQQGQQPQQPQQPKQPQYGQGFAAANRSAYPQFGQQQQRGQTFAAGNVPAYPQQHGQQHQYGQNFAARNLSAYQQHAQQQSSLSPYAPAFQSQTRTTGTTTGTRALGRPRQQQYRQPGGEPFRPMKQVLNPDAVNRPLTEAEIAFRREHGISNNYRGDTANPLNRSADIPDTENCSLFVTNLPPKCTYKDLLGAIARHRPGRVYSSFISPPDTNTDPSLPSHRTCAAKVIFYTPAETQRFISVVDAGFLNIQGYVARVRHNRCKTPAQPSILSQTSRCLVISGPQAIVDEVKLRALFDKHFRYETEEVILRQEGDGLRWLEWRFASYRAQAGSAIKLLPAEYGSTVTVKYARDPCMG